MPRIDTAQRVRIWDPALRLFHWTLVVLVTTTFLLGKFGPKVMTLHFWLGYAIIGLLVFRLVWGFVGPEPARFSSFLRGPRAVLAYARGLLRREPSLYPGHNPLGGLSAAAMLLALAWQAGTGLISDPEDFLNVGPLADEVGRELAKAAVGWHNLGANIVLALVLLHVAAIVFYRVWKNEDLVTPMITGWKWVRGRHP